MRFFLNNTFTVLATSVTITVAAPTVTPSATTVAPGATVSATIADGPANSRDWVGLFATGAPAAVYLRAAYLNDTLTPPNPGVAGGTLTFTMPLTPGTYQRAVLPEQQFHRPRDERHHHGRGARVTLSATTVAPGATVSATIAGGPANSLDWVGFYSTGAPPAGYLRAAVFERNLDPAIPGGGGRDADLHVAPDAGHVQTCGSS